ADLINNMPFAPLRFALKLMLFPFGRPVRKPTDKLEQKVARLLQTPNNARSRLAAHIYTTDEPLNLLGKQEQTLKDILDIEPLFDKICRAKGQKIPFMQLDKVAADALDAGIISKDEADKLAAVEAKRLAVINVDDFDPADLLAGKARVTETNSSAA
ncbi:MAG: acyl-CoA dehydrogenase, partial [Pseudoalteromonas sp.]|nr:acyl-CoA dehydrogenase [Pseudoalteromonas sp.]